MGTLADQDMVEKALIHAKVKMHWHLWGILKEPFVVREDFVLRHKERVKLEKEINNSRQVKQYNKEFSTHMIVAALIATVALTAGFAMPGGFDDDKGPLQGSALLLRKKAFRTFIVTDTMAGLSSISSLFLYFVTTLYKDARRIKGLVVTSALLNVFSIIAMMLAFNTGTYAVLAHSLPLAITVCLISSLFFFLVFSVIFIKIFYRRRKKLFIIE
ncbi:PGG domain-containing protein [Heracleum sosnowskyi]|uniref:PGG domain-containing protein n=1 Tax=Heracleum sosnowskyi TaxID=360622 RepID=A0AAD8JEK9_9APIA|nr:PGG domain-containing protein [Heracleum sosnowskyi]